MRSVVDRNVVMRRITAYLSGDINQKFLCNDYNGITHSDATLSTLFVYPAAWPSVCAAKMRCDMYPTQFI